MGSGFRASLGFRAWGLGFSVPSSGLRARDLGGPLFQAERIPAKPCRNHQPTSRQSRFRHINREPSYLE